MINNLLPKHRCETGNFARHKRELIRRNREFAKNRGALSSRPAAFGNARSGRCHLGQIAIFFTATRYVGVVRLCRV
jgi:hypothetical protein